MVVVVGLAGWVFGGLVVVGAAVVDVVEVDVELVVDVDEVDDVVLDVEVELVVVDDSGGVVAMPALGVEPAGGVTLAASALAVAAAPSAAAVSEVTVSPGGTESVVAGSSAPARGPDSSTSVDTVADRVAEPPAGDDVSADERARAVGWSTAREAISSGTAMRPPTSAATVTATVTWNRRSRRRRTAGVMSASRPVRKLTPRRYVGFRRLRPFPPTVVGARVLRR